MDTVDSSYDTGSSFEYKFLLMLVLFLIAFIGSLVPFVYRSNTSLISKFGNCFSGGIFLSTAFLHLLPETIESFRSLDSHVHFPISSLLIMAGIILPFFIEQVMLQSCSYCSPFDDGPKNEQQDTSTKLRAYLLSLALVMHSFLEGAALGIEKNYRDVNTIFIAIASHKFFSGFALGMSLVISNLATRWILHSLLGFSISTPFGIAIGFLLSKILPSTYLDLSSEVIASLTCGTFIYVSIVEILLVEFKKNKNEKSYYALSEPCTHSDPSLYKKFLALLVGGAVMGVFIYFGH